MEKVEEKTKMKNVVTFVRSFVWTGVLLSSR